MLIPFRQSNILVKWCLICSLLPSIGCKTQADNPFKHGSGLTIQVNQQNIAALTALGQLWVFLKYHHPAVASGRYNWDAELIRELPKVLAAKSKTEYLRELEKWVDLLPNPDTPGSGMLPENPADIKLQSDYGDLFIPGYLPDPLSRKLKRLLDNTSITSNHYMGLEKGTGNPKIQNEDAYDEMGYPDDGFRLLALYRYWGIVQYFFPYRHLIGENWKNALPEFIPIFLNAKDATDYLGACLRLAAKVHDSHAIVFKTGRTPDAFWGNYYPPFSTKFIEGKLVVDQFYIKKEGILRQVSRGDVITHINGKPVAERIKAMIPFMPASNYPTQLLIIGTCILYGETDKLPLTLMHSEEHRTLEVPRYKKIHYTEPDPVGDLKEGGYKTIEENVGYIYSGKYKNSRLPDIKKAFKSTKGIIVDMRYPPSEPMPFTFGEYLKDKPSPFVTFTIADIRHPGRFSFAEILGNGKETSDYYNGKILVLVNEETRSETEYTTMAFQSARNVTVMGSTTAGADGNVSKFYLPGGLATTISGIGVYYPDRTETQRTGVKIDIVVRPTLKGFRAGKDELLQKAIELIKQQRTAHS